MKGNSIACAVLIVAAIPCRAELTIKELEHQPDDARVAELFQLAQGDLFLRARGWRETRSPSTGDLPSWNVIYVLDPEGQVKQRMELPEGRYLSIVPYRNGFAVQRIVPAACAPRCGLDALEQSQILAYEHATDAEPKMLYRTQSGYHTLRLVGAPDAQDLYVMEVGMPGHQLTRIDSHGQVVWQRPSEWLEAESFVATDDGIALVQYVSKQDRTMVLRALDREGRLRWQTPLSFQMTREALFSPAGFINLRAFVQGGGQRVVNFDARTGNVIADVSVEPFTYAVGTRDGLLMAGPMLGQSYLGMFGSDGKFAWLRRYVADAQVNEVHRAMLTRAGKLVFAFREAEPTTDIPTTFLVITDGTAASFGETRGRCLSADWSRSVELASQLRDRGLVVEPPTAGELAGASQSCSEREAQFIAFMKTLAAALPPVAKTDGPRQTISVRLVAAGEPLRLESYLADRSAYPTARVYLSFTSSYDRATEFGKVVSTQVLPHLERMRALDDRFAEMTGFRYVALAHERNQLPSYGDTLAGLEQVARTVNERVGRIPPEKLAEFRETGPIGWVPILLQLDGLGSREYEMYPAAAADRTFLDIAERNRRDAKEGRIIIRD